MHPNNPYSSDYDFERLVKQSPELARFVFKSKYDKQTINFGDNEAIKALNTSLLKVDYGIEWHIPEKNLCPPIPGRLDYLLHVADLISITELRVLDIGTGANLIYPILGVSHFNWQCTASEVNPDSLKHAEQLISDNTKLEDVELRFQKFKSKIFNGIIEPGDFFDAVVCNPPFFKNRTDAEKRNQRKVQNLGLQEKEQFNFGGLSNELWYKGGEEAFIKKMVAESAQFKMQVHWFTVLVSQKEHLKNIKRAINKTKPTKVKIIDMQQGNKSSRLIAWTFK